MTRFSIRPTLRIFYSEAVSVPDRWVLASSDLNARARILEAAGPIEVVTTEATGFSTRLEAASVLILDLDEGGETALKELTDARSSGVVPPIVVGFMSHVDRDLGRAARAAGCRPIARGRFWSHLPDELGPG